MIKINQPAKRLTYLERMCILPRISPDGTKITFSLCSRERGDIFVMNIDGSDLRCLTSPGLRYCDSSFSPDSRSIVFVASDLFYEEIYNIHIMNIDSSEHRALTSSNQDAGGVFSPDGKEIVFVSGRDRSLEIYKMNSDGSNQLRLTNFHESSDLRPGNLPRSSSPVYSPYGTHIVFVSKHIGQPNRPDYFGRVEFTVSQIFQMLSDGAEVRPLFPLDTGCHAPIFSPNGEWIAFENSEKSGVGPMNICLVRTDGTDFRKLPDSHGIYKSFHPSGDRIVFASSREKRTQKQFGDIELYCINTINGSLERLTDNVYLDTCPIFTPDGKTIIFCFDRDGFKEIYSMNYEV